MKVVLINPYEIGRQPFGLAEAAAWLARAGCEVHCLDLTLQRLDPGVLRDAHVVAIYVAMHTATRIAIEAIPRVRELAPGAHLCVYGLYAPMNEQLLRELGVQTVLGGEVEPALVSLVQRLRAGDGKVQTEPVVNLSRIEFMTPDRRTLPPLERYAHLQLPDGGRKTVGFAEGTRGCKHLCRHCPVVPVYHGTFRVIPVDTVMSDVRQQVAAGAQHISFGDPDFLNGPTHALKLVQALHAEFPGITYDATIKIQHIINYADLLPELKAAGCLFITAAVESVDDRVLALLVKNHTNADFARALTLCRAAGIALAPTFVAFTPWTTLEGYVALLERLLELDLVESVPPVQLAIRLLIPQGSLLLELPEMQTHIGEFDPRLLGYPWKNPDARVDRLQLAVQELVARSEAEQASRREIFASIWKQAHAALGVEIPQLETSVTSAPIPRLSEPWYCCAEPTHQQLQSF
ncbi:MAG: CUAEP/CCAEP-tail radical SAM protein [Gammaproteobacteria bacterium]|nr:CUAEP/CCAEP-tail radical SAM protein [Gammaproteobacteria bacterium]